MPLFYTQLLLINKSQINTQIKWSKLEGNFNQPYITNQINKREPKSEARVSKFDWHDLPYFLK